MHETRPFMEAKEGRHEIDRIDERGEVVTCTIEGDEACCIGDDPAEPVLSPLLGHQIIPMTEAMVVRASAQGSCHSGM